jgi:hypothetical protein
MSLVAVLDVLIVVLLGALVVLEILRPRRIRHLMAEVDRRTEEITTALDAAQERMERTLSEFAGAEAADDRSRSGPVGGDGDRRREEPAGEEIELDAAVDAGPEPQARELREKIARLLEDAGRERSERERRLLHQLQETLERPPGADRFEQEKALYSALEAAAGESGPRTPTESPEEERELIAKLRREARR